MRKLPSKCIVWLPYFDASKTRRKGRRIPKRTALTLPKLEEIVEAAEKLGLNPKPNSDVRFPRSCWHKTGSVVVDKLGSKENTLMELAKKILEVRHQSSTR